MKKILLTLSGVCLFAFTTFSQSTTITPGSILPNMTTAQRTTVASPPNGMLVFDNTTQSYWFRQSGVWVELGSTSSFWQLNGLNGNELKNTNTGGFWSANPTVVNPNSFDLATAPINGDGTRMMWIPSRSAFRAGTVFNGVKSWDADSIGLYSVALGANTKAKGRYSTAMGAFTTASGRSSTAMGENTTAFGESSTAMGKNTTASGAYSTATGWATIASGSFSTAMGRGTTASGAYATAMGENTTAFGNSSTAMGESTLAKARGGMSIGSFNDIADSPSFFSSSTDRIFQIGNGVDDSNRSNILTVLRNGSIGTYNVTNPKANLHLQYTQALNWDAHLRLEYSTTQYGNIVYDFDGLKFRTWGTGDDFFFRNAANTTVARINDTGNMTISGTLTQNSDRTLKKKYCRVGEFKSEDRQIERLSL